MTTAAQAQIKAAKKAAKEESDSRTREKFFDTLRKAGIPAPEYEYKFHETRLWRADYFWKEYGIHMEVEGGIWTGGRHVRGGGFIKDMEKYNETAAQGNLLIRCRPNDLCNKSTIGLIARTIESVKKRRGKKNGRA